jgi:hypothetical protein
VGQVAPDTLSRYVMVVGRPTVVTIPNYQIDNLRALVHALSGASEQASGPSRPRGARLRALAAVAAAATLLARGVAAGHTGGSNGYATIVVEGPDVRYRLALWPATLPPAIADELRDAGAGTLAARDGVLALVRKKVTLRAAGRRCEPGQGTATTSGRERHARRGLHLRQPRPRARGARRPLRCAGPRLSHAGPDRRGRRTTQFAFTPETREARVTVDVAPSHGTLGFIRLGVEHILTGWDHLLFLLGLLLRGGSALALAKIITAFTLAHSVTLALAVLDVVVLPGRLVEAVIALSIAVVAAENLFLRPVVARRWLVSFCFGLVHGFGFSAALREIGLPSHGLALSLFGFNAGVELGQALVVAVALPLLLLLRRTRWERRMVWSSSLAILVVGVVLFVERAFF